MFYLGQVLWYYHMVKKKSVIKKSIADVSVWQYIHCYSIGLKFFHEIRTKYFCNFTTVGIAWISQFGKPSGLLASKNNTIL